MSQTVNGQAALRGKRTLVTGATGMVGSWLVKELLSQGAQVVALVQDMDPKSELISSGDIQHCSVVNGCLQDFATIERAINLHAVNTIFHLGAQTQVTVAFRSPLETFESNIRGTYNLLEAARRLPDLVKRVVVASSDKAYGTHLQLPYTEDMPLNGQHPYEVSKSCADLLAQSYYHSYGLPVAIARCGNIYGGGDLNWERIVPGTIRAFLRREQPVLRSDGTYVRDYIYVKDAVRAYLRLAERLPDSDVLGEGFNFAAACPLSVLEMVGAIQKLMDCQDIQPLIRAEAQGEIRDQYLSAAKAKASLDWSPAFPLNEGLTETIDWYRASLN